jgi:hypothetical protein
MAIPPISELRRAGPGDAPLGPIRSSLRHLPGPARRFRRSTRGQLVSANPPDYAHDRWVYELNVYDLRRRLWVSKTEQPEMEGLHSKGAYRSVATSSKQRVIAPAKGGDLKASSKRARDTATRSTRRAREATSFAIPTTISQRSDASSTSSPLPLLHTRPLPPAGTLRRHRSPFETTRHG